MDTNVLIDTGSMADTITLERAELMDLPVRKLAEIAKRKINVQGLGGHVTRPLGFVEYNLRVPGVAGYNEDRVALVIPDDSPFAKRVPLIIGTGTIDRVIACVKESEIGPLPTSWQRVRIGRMLASKAAQIDWEQDKYSNKGYKNLLDVDELVKVKTRIVIPASTNRLVKAKTDLVLLGTKMLVMAEPLKATDPALPPGVHVRPCLTEYHMGSQSITIELYNTLDRAVVVEKGTPVARMYAGDLVPEKTLFPGTLEALDAVEVPRPPVDEAKLTPEERKKKVLEDLDLSGLEKWRERTKERALNLVAEYNDIFSLDKGEIGCTNLVEHKIELTDKTPYKERPRPLPEGMIKEVREHLAQMQALGAIRPSNSPWSNAVVLVRKKDGGLRFCIDFRRLNARTKKDAYPLPRIQESLDCLRGCAHFSTVDLYSGFWQARMADDSKPYTAFTVGTLGFYQCERMPFGLCNAPATFQRLMQNCLGDLNYTVCLIYLDDIVIFSETEDQQVDRLRLVFEKLREHGLKLKPSKCRLFMDQIDYLGHRVSAEGIRPNKDKIKAIAACEPPSTYTGLRQFLGMAGYYRRFVKNYSKIAAPLNQMLEDSAKLKREKIQLTREAMEAFEDLKGRMLTTPILAYPDPSKEYLLETDASGHGLGAVLSQKQKDGRYHPVAYGSRSLTKAEKKYHSTRLEFLAMKWAIADHFSYYLLGHKFRVKTDNNPLTYCLTSAKLDAIRQRWIEELAPYDFSIEYQRGRDNTVADFLSRITSRLSPEETEEYLKGVPDEALPPDEGPREVRLQSEVVKALLDEVTSGAARRVASVPSRELPERGEEDSPVLCQSRRPEEKAEMHVTDWREEQRKIPEFRMMVDWIKRHRASRLPWEEKFAKLKADYGRLYDTAEGKALVKVADKLVLVNGILYYRHDHKMEATPVLRFVVPPPHRRKALDGCHRDAGHWGLRKTHSLVEDRFWWPSVRHDVEQMYKACGRCTKFERKGGKAPLHPIIVSTPLELVHVDFAEMETTMDLKKQPNTVNVLVVQDHFTRYMRAFITKDQKARTAAKLLYDEFIVVFGAPQRILSDNGAAFTAELIKELCDRFGIERSITTPYHPMGNGLVERSHQTLRRMIGKLSDPQKNNWTGHLTALIHVYNCTRSAVTGYSPHYLMFGRRPRLPVDLMFPSDPGPVAGRRRRRVDKLMRDRIDVLRDAYRAAQQLSLEEARRQKRYYDRKAGVTSLQAEDIVLIRNDAYRGKRKLVDHWGDIPHKVVSQVEDLPVYVVEEPSGRQKPIHRNRLFLVTRPEPGNPPLVLSQLQSAVSEVLATLQPSTQYSWEKDHPPLELEERDPTHPDPVEIAAELLGQSHIFDQEDG